MAVLLVALLTVTTQLEVVDASPGASALAPGVTARVSDDARVVMQDAHRDIQCALFPGPGLTVTVDAEAPAGLDIEGATCTAAGPTVRCHQAQTLVALCRVSPRGPPRSTTGARSTPPPVVSPGGARVFVSHFDAEDGTGEPAKVLADLAAVELTELGFDVVTSADVDALVQQEVRLQTAGCAEASCLSELAGMLGAEYLVMGHVASGERDALVTDLRLVDADDGHTLAAESVVGRNLDRAAHRLPPTVRRLTASLTNRPAPALPPPYLGRLATTGSAFAAAGAVAASVVPVGIGLTAATGLLVAFVRTPAWLPFPYALFSLWAMLPLVPAAAVAASVVADMLADAVPDPRRAGLVAGTTLFATVTAMALAGTTAISVPTLLALTVYAADPGAFLDDPVLTNTTLALGFAAAGTIAVAAIAAAAGGAYLGGIAVWGDEPLDEEGE